MPLALPIEVLEPELDGKPTPAQRRSDLLCQKTYTRRGSILSGRRVEEEKKCRLSLRSA